MKTFILSIAILSFFYGDVNKVTFPMSTSETKDLLIIVTDRSASIKVSSVPNPQEIKILKTYFNKNLKPKTDVLLMNVDSHSGSPVNNEFIYFKQAKKGQTGFQSDEDKVLEKNLQDMEDRKQVKKMQAIILKKILSNHQASNNTYLIDILPKISEHSKPYSRVYILFISDMLEDSSRIRVKSFVNKKSAESKGAIEVMKLIEDYGLNSDALKKVQSVNVLVPANTNPETIINVDYFWQIIFSRLGYRNKVEWQTSY
ncbi:MAG: hypothetical protein PSV16_00545 [Flavobacterium sp.]|nr:hypothetical protein [Flavobacterium sp.]